MPIESERDYLPPPTPRPSMQAQQIEPTFSAHCIGLDIIPFESVLGVVGEQMFSVSLKEEIASISVAVKGFKSEVSFTGDDADAFVLKYKAFLRLKELNREDGAQ